MENVFYFAFVGLIVIISLYAILKILIKKFDPEKTRVKLYGILGGMSNKEISAVKYKIPILVLDGPYDINKIKEKIKEME